ncbi:uncharacterized protein YgbK (DUF1537 family) [Paraburkholderia sp. GAS348]
MSSRERRSNRNGAALPLSAAAHQMFMMASAAGYGGEDDAVEADALVVALKSRTIPAADAVAQSLAALNWLRAQGCRQFFFKYCSTFDSTDAGNIGPVTDALLDALSAEVGAMAFTIACPAFSENGRTIYRGYLFVGDTLLNESGMENHPLTPMRDANLVRVLQRQTGSKVGLVRYDTVAKGVSTLRESFDALRGDGVRMAIADAVSDADLYVLGEACADLTLITGGSGVALGLPGNFPPWCRRSTCARCGSARRSIRACPPPQRSSGLNQTVSKELPSCLASPLT